MAVTSAAFLTSLLHWKVLGSAGSSSVLCDAMLAAFCTIQNGYLLLLVSVVSISSVSP